MALGVLRALHEAGRAVPAEVSVVGFDDMAESASFWPPLTTVRQFFGEVGTARSRRSCTRSRPASATAPRSSPPSSSCATARRRRRAPDARARLRTPKGGRRARNATAAPRTGHLCRHGLPRSPRGSAAPRPGRRRLDPVSRDGDAHAQQLARVVRDRRVGRIRRALDGLAVEEPLPRDLAVGGIERPGRRRGRADARPVGEREPVDHRVPPDRHRVLARSLPSADVTTTVATPPFPVVAWVTRTVAAESTAMASTTGRRPPSTSIS